MSHGSIVSNTLSETNYTANNMNNNAGCGCPGCCEEDALLATMRGAEQNTAIIAETGSNTGVEALRNGYKFNSSEITFTFDATGSWMSSEPDWIQSTTEMQTSARLVFEHLEEFTNLTFTETTNPNADIVFGVDSSITSGGWKAYAYYPAAQRSAVLFQSNLAGWDPYPGGQNHYVMLHELGHSMGLKHPHQGGSINVVLPSDEDSTNSTVMSYSSGSSSKIGGSLTGKNTSNIKPETYQIYDIAELQYLYGANHNFKSGNDIYEITGNEVDRFTLWDGAGEDTLSAATTSSDNVIDLREGLAHITRIGSSANWIAFGANIENAFGGAGDDTIHGNNLDNELVGNEGNDRVNGYNGNDMLYGKAGSDTLNGQEGNDSLKGGSGDDSLAGGQGDDLLEGSSGSDTLIGGSGEDRLYGGSSADSLEGGSGADTLQGNDGNDTLSGYHDNDLLRGGKGDDILYGNAGDDTVLGDSGNDRIYGQDGEDRLYGGTGIDTLDGGNGDDYLSGGKQDDMLSGEAGNDTLKGDGGFDSLIGGSGNDILDGSAGNDSLDGGSEDDHLLGGSGTDSLIGGSGNDTLSGGSGTDYFYFTTNNEGDDLIVGFMGAGSSGGDVLLFSTSIFADNNAVLSSITYQNNDAIIDLGGGHQLTVDNIAVSSLTADDFSLIN